MIPLSLRQAGSVSFTGAVVYVIRPTHPWKRAYLMWLRVVYTKTPLSSHAADLIRIVS